MTLRMSACREKILLMYLYVHCAYFFPFRLDLLGSKKKRGCLDMLAFAQRKVNTVSASGSSFDYIKKSPLIKIRGLFCIIIKQRLLFFAHGVVDANLFISGRNGKLAVVYRLG